jgi:hypothetical protein
MAANLPLPGIWSSSRKQTEVICACRHGCPRARACCWPRESGGAVKSNIRFSTPTTAGARPKSLRVDGGNPEPFVGEYFLSMLVHSSQDCYRLTTVSRHFNAAFTRVGSPVDGPRNCTVRLSILDFYVHKTVILKFTSGLAKQAPAKEHQADKNLAFNKTCRAGNVIAWESALKVK